MLLTCVFPALSVRDRDRGGLKETTYVAYLERPHGDEGNAVAAAAADAAAHANPSSLVAAERGGGREVLLWARRWRKARAAQYVISTDLSDLAVPRQQRGPGYMGKLKAVAGERVYALYDGGEKSNGTRRETAVVIYTHERAAVGTVFEPKMEVSAEVPANRLAGSLCVTANCCQ